MTLDPPPKSIKKATAPLHHKTKVICITLVSENLCDRNQNLPKKNSIMPKFFSNVLTTLLCPSCSYLNRRVVRGVVQGGRGDGGGLHLAPLHNKTMFYFSLRCSTSGGMESAPRAKFLQRHSTEHCKRATYSIKPATTYTTHTEVFMCTAGQPPPHTEMGNGQGPARNLLIQTTTANMPWFGQGGGQ